MPSKNETAKSVEPEKYWEEDCQRKSKGSLDLCGKKKKKKEKNIVIHNN